MKTKLTLVVSVLVIAFLGFATAASAQEASVFGNDVLIRAFLTGTGPYSAYLEVRDEAGVKLLPGEFYVNGTMGTADPDDTVNPVQIHNNDVVNPDISISYDDVADTVYVFCTDTDHGLHVMKYKIGLTSPAPPAPVNGACGSASGGTFSTLSSTSSGLCSPGTVSNFQGTGPWTWSCLGSNGGTNATNCSAQLQQSSGSPDLTVSVSGWPSSYNVGSSFTIRVTVNNQGNAAASPFNVKVLQSGGVVGTW